MHCPIGGDGFEIVKTNRSTNANAAKVASKKTIVVAVESEADLEKFASVLRTLLESKGITQDELARRCKVSRQAIGQLLSGRHSPTLRTIARIAGVIGCKADVSFSEQQ